MCGTNLTAVGENVGIAIEMGLEVLQDGLDQDTHNPEAVDGVLALVKAHGVRAILLALRDAAAGAHDVNVLADAIGDDEAIPAGEVLGILAGQLAAACEVTK